MLLNEMNKIYQMQYCKLKGEKEEFLETKRNFIIISHAYTQQEHNEKL